MKSERSYGTANESNMERNATLKGYIDEECVEELDANFAGDRITAPGKMRLCILLSFVFSMIFIFAVMNNKQTILLTLDLFGSQTKKSNIFSGLTAVVTNEYSYRNLKMFPYPFLKNALLMEPYRISTVTVTGMTDTSCSLNWKLKGLGLVSSESFEGTSTQTGDFTVEPHLTGEYVMSVEEICGGVSSGKMLSQTVWVKYVRRELQSLTDVDREEFLDAFRTLWQVPTVEGQAKYGSKYKSLFYLAAVHNDAGGNSICDEFHAGSGFVSNHMYLSAYLEQSLRLINPKVSLHYMEYSKYFSSDDFQKHMENQLDGGAWTEILSDKFFGRNDPVTGEILDGRWAHSAVPYVNEDFYAKEGIDKTMTWFPVEQTSWLAVNPPHISSPYGLLRAPWNYNPATFTVRYNNVNQMQATSVSNTQLSMYKGSTCDDYETFIKTAAVGQTLETYLYEAEDNVHGKIHFTFGGAGGDYAKVVDDKLRSEYGLTDDNIFAIARAAQVFFKTYVPLKGTELDYEYPLECSANPWQNGALTSSASPGEEGGPTCTCSSYYFTDESTLTELITLWKIKDNAFLYSLDLNQRKEAMKLICSRMSFDGDMAGSGAATDPLFWVAHGAVERLFQRVVFEGVLADKVYVNPKRNQCSGHLVDGTKKWLQGFYLQDPSVDVSTLTNEQLTEILDPTGIKFRDLVDFVYEDADFAWCKEFDSWFDTTTASPKKKQTK